MMKAVAMKYLPIAILFVLVVAILCMSRYAENRKENHQNNANHINPAATVAPDKTANGARPADQSEDSPSWIDTFAWPDGVTAWALFLTLFIIAWQSVETHAAADATKASVEAAKGQAALIREQVDTQIERERARLNLEAQPIEIPEGGFDDSVELTTCIEITNVGHSNAFIRDGAARFALISIGNLPFSQPSPEDFTPFSMAIEPSKEPVYSPIQCDYIPLSRNDFTGDMAESTRSLYLYGWMEYESLGIRWHRDFGYVWKIAEDARESPDPSSPWCKF
jgi:hypothetical protein